MARLLTDDEVFGNAEPQQPQRQGGLLSDEEVFGVAQPPAGDGADVEIGPVQIGPVRGERPDDPTQAWEPTIGQRFTENVREGWRNNLIGNEITQRRIGTRETQRADTAADVMAVLSEMGADEVPDMAAIQQFNRTRADSEGMPNPLEADMMALLEQYQGQDVSGLEQIRSEAAAEAARRREENLPGEIAERQRYQAMQGFAEDGGVLGTPGRGLTSLTGQLVGAGASPENLVPVTRGPTLLNTFGRGAGVNALISAGIDPVIQSTERDLGLREGFSLTNTGINAALGGLLGGGFNVAPDVAAGIRSRVMGNRGEQIDPNADFSDTVVSTQEILDAARREGLPVDEAIARVSGTDAPEPMPRGTREERAAAMQREGELADVFAQPEVTRRANIDEAGDAIVPPEGSRAPRPDTARDETGSQLSTDELAARRAVSNAMRDQGVRLTPERLRVAREEVLRGADPAETVRSYSPDAAEDAFTQSRWRRFQRDQEVSEGRQSGRDFQPGGRPRDEGAALTMLDARRGPDGRLSGGTPVERTNQLVQGPDGEALQIVRIDGQETAVPVSRLSEVPRSDNPRMEQDFQDRAPRRRPGVGEDTDPVPRRSTDDISGTQAARTRQPDDFDFQPAPRSDEPEPQGPFDPDFGPNAERAAPRGLPRNATEGRQQPRAQTGQTQPGEPRSNVISDQEAASFEARAQRAEPQVDALNSSQLSRIAEDMGYRVSARNRDDGIRARLMQEHPDDIESALSRFGVQDDAPRQADMFDDPASSPAPRQTEQADAAPRQDEPTAGVRASEDSNRPAGTRAETDSSDPRTLDSDPAGMADRPGVDTYRVGGGTLYSGIPLNVITDAIRRVFRTAFTGDEAAMRAYSTRMRDMIGDLRAVKERTSNLPIGSIMRSTWELSLGSVDGRFRGLANRYDSKILTSLADAFHQTAGGRAAQGRDQQTLSARRDSTLNRFGKPFKAIADTMAQNGIGRRDRAALQRIRKMIENPRSPRRGAEGKVARDVEKFMRDMHKYQRDKGVDIGQVEGYFPRWLDRGLVAKNRDAFVNKATRAYQKMNMSEPEARRSAAALADAVMHAGDSNLRAETPGGAGAVGDATKPRKLSRAAADELDAFWQTDIEGAMANYMQAAVKRAEIADTTVRVGDQDIKLGEGFENWPEIETALRREMEAKGMDGNVINNDLKTVRDHVLASTGMHLSNASAAGMTASAWLRAMGGVSLMDRVAIASFPELMTGALRATSGNGARDVATNLRNLRFHLEGVAGAITRRATGGRAGRQKALEEAYDLAEYLGAIAGDAFSYSMQARLMGDEPTSRALAGLQDKFYKNVGLTQLNDYTRVTALRHANHFMRSLSRDVLRDGRNANRARFNLRDLGVKRGQEREFADFFARNFGDDMPTAARLQQLTEAGGKDGRMAGAYGRAIQTFVDQSVMRPDTSTRPRWASNPAGAVAFHLLGFTWAFQRNVVNRIGRIATDKQDLSMIDRAQMLGGFAPAAASMYGIAMLGGKLRDALNDAARTDEPTPRTKAFEAERAFTYSGFSGKLDPFLQLAAGLRYQRSPAETLAGPSLGGVLSAAEAFMNQSLNSSDNTNTAERRASRELHRVVLTPILQAGLTMVPGGGFVTNAARSGAAITGVRSTREPFVDAIAGEEDEAVTRRRTSNPTEGFIESQINRRRDSNDPAPAGRASSRQSSRGGTRESSRESSR